MDVSRSMDASRSEKGLLQWRQFAYIALTAAVCIAVTAYLSATAIRGIDDILDVLGLSDFARIFSALDTAELELHMTLPTAISFLYSAVVITATRRRLERGKSLRRCIAVAAPVGFLLLILAVIGSVLLTEVNGIRFGTVLLSLYENIDALGGM